MVCVEAGWLGCVPCTCGCRWDDGTVRTVVCVCVCVCGRGKRNRIVWAKVNKVDWTKRPKYSKEKRKEKKRVCLFHIPLDTANFCSV